MKITQPENKIILESSLGRVLQLLQGTGFAQISPYRFNIPDRENKNRFYECVELIRSFRYGFFKVIGRYVDSVTKIESEERGFLIPNQVSEETGEKPRTPLLDLVLKLMDRYDQDSVLWVENGNAYFLYGNGTTKKLGTFIPQKWNSYMTIIKRQNDKTGRQEDAYHFVVEQINNHIDAMFYKRNKIYRGVYVYEKTGDFVSLG